MPSSALQGRLDETLSHEVLRARLRHEEAELAAENAEREAARRQRQRDTADRRSEIQATYADAYASFGAEVPLPFDDEPPSQYCKRLFNRLARRLAPDHELAQIRADDVSGQAVVFDNFERMLLEAATAEGVKPSYDNLPADNSLIARNRVDAATNERSVEYFGRRSFIADFNQPGKRVVRIMDPRTQNILFGPPLDWMR